SPTEFLLDLFISVRQNLGNSAKIPRGQKEISGRINIAPYYLPSLDATVDQRSFPLGYAWKGQEPDPLLAFSTKGLLAGNDETDGSNDNHDDDDDDDGSGNSDDDDSDDDDS
ncbi:unnamed protein product, partial [Porites lobata]